MPCFRREDYRLSIRQTELSNDVSLGIVQGDKGFAPLGNIVGFMKLLGAKIGRASCRERVCTDV